MSCLPYCLLIFEKEIIQTVRLTRAGSSGLQAGEAVSVFRFPLRGLANNAEAPPLHVSPAAFFTLDAFDQALHAPQLMRRKACVPARQARSAWKRLPSKSRVQSYLRPGAGGLSGAVFVRSRSMPSS